MTMKGKYRRTRRNACSSVILPATNTTQWHLVLNQSLHRVVEETCPVSLLFLRTGHVFTVPCIFARPPVNRHSYWTVTPLKKGPICCAETPVTTKLRRLTSQKSRHFLVWQHRYDLNVWALPCSSYFRTYPGTDTSTNRCALVQLNALL